MTLCVPKTNKFTRGVRLLGALKDLRKRLELSTGDSDIRSLSGKIILMDRRFVAINQNTPTSKDHASKPQFSLSMGQNRNSRNVSQSFRLSLLKLKSFDKKPGDGNFETQDNFQIESRRLENRFAIKLDSKHQQTEEMSETTLELLRHESVNTLPNASPSPKREFVRSDNVNGAHGANNRIAVNVVVEKRVEEALRPATLKPLSNTSAESEKSSDVGSSLFIS